MTVTETETGQTFEVLTEPGFPITTHRRDPDFEVTSIEHDPAEEHTTPIYLHKAADGKLFCSYDVAYHRLEVWLERVEATVFNHINDEVIEQLPDEDYRATTDQPSLEVGELTFTRYRLVDVDVTYHEGGN